MAYVVFSPIARQSALAVAPSRWGALCRSMPDLEPAVRLQQQLLEIVGHLQEDLESRVLRLSLPPRYLAAKLGRGLPALAGEHIPVPAAVIKPVLLELCEALAAGGAGETAEHIRIHLSETRMNPGALLIASLKRDQDAIRSSAVQQGLAPDLLWLVAELAISPYAHALEQALFGALPIDSPLREALDAWSCGYCPLCGSWPALAEVAGGHRVLRCSFCALAWEPAAWACVYCGGMEEAFSTAVPEPERPDRRLELCRSCGCYLKAVDVEALSPFPLVAITDMETMKLDAAAMAEGYGRPSTRQFGAGRT